MNLNLIFLVPYLDDNCSYIVQIVGLILALVKFVEEYVDENYVDHSCEIEICENDVKTSDDRVINDDETLEEQGTFENVENSTVNEENVESEDSLPQIINDEPSIEIENDFSPNVDNNVVDEAAVSTNPDLDEPEVEVQIEITRERIKAMKQFRVSSPSYQAVQVSIRPFLSVVI